MDNLGYNPTYRGYNSIYNWLGPTLQEPHRPDVVLIESFELLRKRFTQGDPKSFLAEVRSPPALVFTDRALETADDGELPATIGAVSIFAGGGTFVFGCKVESSVLKTWLQEHVHPIGLIELYGVGAAYHVWKDSLANRKAIFSCDNWSA